MRSKLLLWLFTMGCADPMIADLPGDHEGSDDGEPLVPYIGGSYQGRHILGNVADTLVNAGWHVSVAPTSTINGVPVTVTVNGTALVATDGAGVTYTAPNDFVGMVFAGPTAQLRIDAVSLDPVTGAPRYEIAYQTVGGLWRRYCDAAINPRAVAFQGRWNTRRYHLDGPELSFGCVGSGVSAKCVDWGYVPGDKGGSKAWKNHQSCTTMANANYCDTGAPYTRELTPIEIRDFTPGAQPDALTGPPLETLTPTQATWPPADRFYFEAAWQAYGPAICLSRLRWASLPPGGHCPTEVPDPRVPGPDGRGVFCDDLSLAELQTLGARHLSAVLPMDIAQHIWKHPLTGDLVTTVAGYVEGITKIEPFPGYGTWVRSDAILLRNLTGALDPATDVVEVFHQHNATTRDHVVAPRDPSTGGGITPGHTVLEREGYLLTAPGADRVHFGLYLHTNGKDYVSAMTNPDSTKYVFQYGLGYAIAP